MYALCSRRNLLIRERQTRACSYVCDEADSARLPLSIINMYSPRCSCIAPYIYDQADTARLPLSISNMYSSRFSCIAPYIYDQADTTRLPLSIINMYSPRVICIAPCIYNEADTARLAYTRYCFVSGLVCTNQYHSLRTLNVFGHPTPPRHRPRYAQYHVFHRRPVIAICTTQYWQWQ